MTSIDYLEKFSLKNKIAFVTGAVGLLGHPISEALASAGAEVVMLDINKVRGEKLQKELSKKGYKVNYNYFDVTDFKQMESIYKMLVAKYDHIDILVNSAYPRTKDWLNKVECLSIDSWQKNIDMQLNSTAWLNKLAAETMKNQKSGSIINIGSIYGVVGNDFNIYRGTNMTSPMAYSAIKGGIVNLSRYLASYFGKYNVRINTVCPGGIFDLQDKKFVKKYSEKVPLKRMGNPEEVASVVLFLASEAASYINGATVMVDGGWTAI